VSLTYNYLNIVNAAAGQQTNGNFGSSNASTSAQNPARHMAVSLRLRF
jgi:hypothetical protein